MKRTQLSLAKVLNLRKAGILLILALLPLLVGVVVLAQTGHGYDLSWWTVDGGGTTFNTGGEYTLGGTIGQPDAGAALTAGDYTLVGGFWGGAATPAPAPPPDGSRIYLPLVLRQFP